MKKNDEDIEINLVLALYKKACPSLPKVTKISESRKRAIKTIAKKYQTQEIYNVFQKAEESDFLREGAKGNGHDNWRANFDWLIKESNFVKVLDGNYDNHKNHNNESDTNTILEQKNRKRNVPHIIASITDEDIAFIRYYAYKNHLMLREVSIKIITEYANHYTLPTKRQENEFLDLMEDDMIYKYRSGERKDNYGNKKFEFKLNTITYKFLSAYAYYNNLTRRAALIKMLEAFKENHHFEKDDLKKHREKDNRLTMRGMFKSTFGFNPDTKFKICGIMDCKNRSCTSCKYKGMSAEEFWNSPYEKCV